MNTEANHNEADLKRSAVLTREETVQTEIMTGNQASAEHVEALPSGQLLAGMIQMLAESIGEGTPVDTIKRVAQTAEFTRLAIPHSSEEEVAEVCDRLGYIKSLLFKATGVLAVIDEAIALGRQSLASTSLSHPKRAMRLDDLGYSLSARYRATGAMKDLEESIVLAKESLQVSPQKHPDRDMYLINLSARLIERHQKTAQTKDLDEAIDLAYQVLRIMQPNAPHRGVTLCNLTALLSIKFEHTGFRRDLDEALRIAHLAQTCSNLTREASALIDSSLATLYAAKYSITREEQDLRESASHSTQSAQATQSFSNERKIRLLSNAAHLTELYQTTMTDDDLENAIVAVSDVMHGHQYMPYHDQDAILLYRCFIFLYGHHFRTNPTIDQWLKVVDAGVYLLKQGFHTESDLVRRQDTLRRLEAHRSRFHVVIEELDEVQVDSDTPLEELSVFSPMASKILSAVHEEFGNLIRTVGPVDALINIIDGPVKIRFDACELEADRTTLKRDIASFGMKTFQISTVVNVPDQAVRQYARLKQEESLQNLLDVQGASESIDTLSTEVLSKLASFYTNLYRSSRQEGELSIAINYSETYLNRMGDSDPNRASILCALVDLHHRKYGQQQNPLDLTPIIRYAEMAFQIPDLGREELLSILPKFTSATRLSFQQTADMDELDKAAGAITLALKLSPSTTDHTLPYTLSMTLKTRYQITGEFRALDIAAQMMQQAMDLAYLNGAGDEAIQMSVNYALIFRLRFLHTNNLDDLDRALDMCQSALEFFDEPMQRLSVLNNLTLILECRYRATDDSGNIDSAIEFAEEALAILMSMEGADHLNTIYAAILTNLANSLSVRFSLTHDLSDIDQAIEHGALALTFATPSSQGPQNSDLCGLYRARYRSTKQRGDLDSAVLHAAEAMEYISESHPLRPLALTQMALCWLEQGDSSNIDDVIGCLKEAFDCVAASPKSRIEAAQLAAKHLVGTGKRIEEAALLLEKAVALMPELGAKWGSSKERQQSVVLCHGLPANAAMVLLESGFDPERALRTLELGRGIIMGSMMDCRRDVSLIKEGDAENAGMQALIREFNHARMRVDDAEPGHERRRLIEEMDRALEAIRAQPGYSDFFSLPTSEDFMCLAKDGPIIVVMTGELVDYGQAILVTSTQITNIRLPSLKHEDATRRMRDLAENILDLEQGDWNRRNQDLFKLLKWIWEFIVAPICGRSGMDILQDGHELVRLRWVGVGVLSKTPFHIAGNYGAKTPNDKIMKYAISSYVPSLRALLYATQKQPKQYLNKKTEGTIMLTKIPDAEGVEVLENVEKEIKAVKQVADSVPMLSLVLDSPSSEEIIKRLPFYNLVHFACHAVADPTDPSESHLILCNGRLKVGDIVKAHAAEPDVAFLSACSTAETQEVKLTDESIHIASSFLMVGFKHVVGTLWQAPDKICMKVAELFYRRLLRDEGEEWDGRWKVAEALHYAILEAQNKLPGSPLGWGPFVTFGA